MDLKLWLEDPEPDAKERPWLLMATYFALLLDQRRYDSRDKGKNHGKVCPYPNK